MIPKKQSVIQFIFYQKSFTRFLRLSMTNTRSAILSILILQLIKELSERTW